MDLVSFAEKQSAKIRAVLSGDTCDGGAFHGKNPKAETRRPKEGRNPKSECSKFASPAVVRLPNPSFTISDIC
jgi:hypothetical protein